MTRTTGHNTPRTRPVARSSNPWNRPTEKFQPLELFSPRFPGVGTFEANVPVLIHAVRLKEFESTTEDTERHQGLDTEVTPQRGPPGPHCVCDEVYRVNI